MSPTQTSTSEVGRDRWARRVFSAPEVGRDRWARRVFSDPSMSG